MSEKQKLTILIHLEKQGKCIFSHEILLRILR